MKPKHDSQISKWMWIEKLFIIKFAMNIICESLLVPYLLQSLHAICNQMHRFSTGWSLWDIHSENKLGKV